MQQDDLRRFTLALSQCPGFGPRTYRDLIQEAGNIELAKTFLNNQHSMPRVLELLISLDEKALEQRVSEFGLSFVCEWEPEYPVLLKQISDPPIVLFYKGDLSIASRSKVISIVGTRNVSRFGKESTQQLSRQLTRDGYVIASGMAFGVDAAAHQACLDEGGQTIAVLAGPAHIPSPSSNKYIYDQILENRGLVVSETFPGTQKVVPGMFAVRNRIVAGLSKSTIVMEAGERSGALITAHLAFDYGRDVYALPRDPGSPAVCGSNKLIKKNVAMLLEGVEDITGSKETSSLSPEELGLEGLRLRIVEHLWHTPSLLEEVCLAFDISTSDGLSLLSMLEISGVISKSEDDRYYFDARK